MEGVELVLEAIEAPIHLNKLSVDFTEPSINLVEAFVDSFEAVVNTFEALVDACEAFVNTFEALVDACEFDVRPPGQTGKTFVYFLLEGVQFLVGRSHRLHGYQRRQEVSTGGAQDVTFARRFWVSCGDALDA